MPLTALTTDHFDCLITHFQSHFHLFLECWQTPVPLSQQAVYFLHVSKKNTLWSQRRWCSGRNTLCRMQRMQPTGLVAAMSDGGCTFGFVPKSQLYAQQRLKESPQSEPTAGSVKRCVHGPPGSPGEDCVCWMVKAMQQPHERGSTGRGRSPV